MSGQRNELCALAEKRRQHREIFKRRSLVPAATESKTCILARKLVDTRSLLLAAEQRAVRAERKLDDEIEDAEVRRVSTKNPEEEKEELDAARAERDELAAAIRDLRIESATFTCTIVAESHALRCELAASTCRQAATLARCRAAEVKSDALQRAIPSSIHENDDAVDALIAVCEALRAAERRKSRDETDLRDKLTTSENKVRILEAHLAKMDAHLAALAHGGSLLIFCLLR